MKNYTTLILVSMYFVQVFGQTEPPSVYGNLAIKKFYNVSTSKSGNIYKVDDVKVEKAVYDRYAAAWEEFGNCCPCILKTYDKDDVLLTEAVQCTDCLVGYYKEFYPNGRLKIFGHYKENPTGDWSNIMKRGYCQVQDGDWLYYGENGKITSIEKWKDGEFVEQQPKGRKPEIWKVETWVNEELQAPGGSIAINNLGAFEIKLRHKNDHRFQAVNVLMSIGGYGQKNKEFEMPMDDLDADKLIEIAQSFKEVSNITLSAKIFIYGDGELIQTIYLSLKINN